MFFKVLEFLPVIIFFVCYKLTNNLILEEVMYTIGLSLCDELDVEEVIFMVNSEEISTFSLKTLD